MELISMRVLMDKDIEDEGRLSKGIEGSVVFQ